MKKVFSVLLCLFLLAQVGHTKEMFTSGTVIEFSSVRKGVHILTTRDEFIERLSDFDRAARMKTDKIVTEKEFLEFVGRNVLDWKDDEKKQLLKVFKALQEKMAVFHLHFPSVIYLIKTTGKEEGHAAYTRQNAIILQEQHFVDQRELQRIVAHELFHILTRVNGNLQDRLYQIIGFHKFYEMPPPSHLKQRLITNPDSPINEYAVQVTMKGENIWVVPILFSGREQYDMTRGGEFFHYLQLGFMVVGKSLDRSDSTQGLQAPAIVHLKQFSGFFEQIGNNTQYIIHPEEILADNFALLLTGAKQVRTPELLQRMKATLMTNQSSENRSLQ